LSGSLGTPRPGFRFRPPPPLHPLETRGPGFFFRSLFTLIQEHIPRTPPTVEGLQLPDHPVILIVDLDSHPKRPPFKEFSCFNFSHQSVSFFPTHDYFSFSQPPSLSRPSKGAPTTFPLFFCKRLYCVAPRPNLFYFNFLPGYLTAWLDVPCVVLCNEPRTNHCCNTSLPPSIPDGVRVRFTSSAILFFFSCPLARMVGSLSDLVRFCGFSFSPRFCVPTTGW